MRNIYLLISACILSLFLISCEKSNSDDNKPDYPSVSFDLTKIDPVTGCPNYYVKAFIEPKTDISNYYIGVINLDVDPKTVINKMDDLVEYSNEKLARTAHLSSWRYNDYYMYPTAFTQDCYKAGTTYIARGFVITDKGEFLWTESFTFKY